MQTKEEYLENAISKMNVSNVLKNRARDWAISLEENKKKYVAIVVSGDEGWYYANVCSMFAKGHRECFDTQLKKKSVEWLTGGYRLNHIPNLMSYREATSLNEEYMRRIDYAIMGDFVIHKNKQYETPKAFLIQPDCKEMLDYCRNLSIYDVIM